MLVPNVQRGGTKRGRGAEERNANRFLSRGEHLRRESEGWVAELDP